jgi:multidrug efflux pump subunit AcrB
MGGRIGNAQFQYTLQGDNLQDLQKWSNIMLERIKALPEMRDSNTDLQVKGLEARAVINRDTAGRLGVDPKLVDDALYSAFGQRFVSTMYKPLNQYHVVMEAELPFQQNPDAFKQMYVRSAKGGEVPLSAFIHTESGVIPQNINHQGQFPAVTLTFNLAEGVALGQAVDAVKEVEREIRLPANIVGSFEGTAQAFQSALSNQPWLILAALVTVYIVLGVLYESYIHPITILSTLPSAGVGALLALLITKSELNVIGIIGIILLIGIVKKNAIMMIDFALEAERREGKGPLEGIYQACLLRFRPIMMTTMAALLGGLPLALGRGTGAELRRPMGIAIVGGLILSQLLTLYTTPVVYLYLDRMRLWFERRSKALPRLVPSPKL